MNQRATPPSRPLASILVFSTVVAGAMDAALAAKPSPGPATTGQWSPVYPWPDVAIHLHVLPDGRVLSYSDDDHPDYHVNGSRLEGQARAFLIDLPAGAPPGTVEEIPNTRTNLFCSGHSFLPDGRLLVMGGHKGRDGWGDTETNLLSYGTNYLWSPGPDMAEGRWYPTAVTLANGEVLVVSGAKDPDYTNNDLPEVYQTNSTGTWRALSSARRALPLYPYLHVAPNGRVFVAGPDATTLYLEASGSGAWSTVASRSGGFRDYGSSVLFDDGRVLVMGGGDPPTKIAEVIDLRAASPVWRTVRTMRYARRQTNATLLPDGKILVTGGTSGGGFNNASGAVYTAEQWDPASERWTTLASAQVGRLYHSTALLLPDGRVLSAGGGRPAGTNGGADNENVEIFSPPYLFKGARPTIVSAPTTASYGSTFFVETPDGTSVSSVTWVRLSTVTHGFNMGQRMNRLGFTRVTGGLQVTAPSDARLCPPGHYMLFLLNGNGVPSVARIVGIR